MKPRSKNVYKSFYFKETMNPDTSQTPKGSFDRYILRELGSGVNFDFSYKNQPYSLDRKRIGQFDQVFECLKGEPKFLRSNVGKIHVPHIIDFKTNRSNFKVFKKELVQQSGLVILLIDVSGSMGGTKINDIRDLVADLMTSAESIPKIELRVFTFAGDYEHVKKKIYNDVLLIHEIETVKNCNEITTMGTTPTPQAIHYLVSKFEKSHKQKTLLVLTDGSPSSYTVSYQKCLLEIKKVLIKAESAKFNIFGVGFEVDDYLTEAMQNSFRGNYVNLWNKEDIQKYLFTALQDFVRNIRK